MVLLPIHFATACTVYDDANQTLTLKSVGITIPTLSDTAWSAPFQYFDLELTNYDPDGDGIANECSFDPGFTCFEFNPNNTNAITFVSDPTPTCVYDASNSTLDPANNTTLDLDNNVFSIYYSRTQTLDVPAIVVDGGVAYSDITFTLRKCLRDITFFGIVFSDQEVPCLRLDSLTVATDLRPNTFSFIDQIDVDFNTVMTSNIMTPTGYNSATNISISNGQYDINASRNWTSLDGIINPSDTVRVRHTSADISLANTVTTLTIGGVSGNFTSTTF
jgi:hypothetical protein